LADHWQCCRWLCAGGAYGGLLAAVLYRPLDLELADMTQEALKLALEALENISTALREDDVLGSDSELMLNAITAIEEALEESENDELIIRYHEMTIKRLEKRIEELTVQPEQERYFCQRCGKPVNLTTIHTCTPPRNAA
jgi:hypothetical protein